MSKTKIKNSKAIYNFRIYMKEAKGGYSESTIDQTERVIHLYLDFTNGTDFSNFNSDKAIGFKEYLKTRKVQGKTISTASIYTYLKGLKKFFAWLCEQPGYKSKINKTHLDYLELSKKEIRMATESYPREYPTLEYVLKITESIKIETEVDMMHIALIAFIASTGMRVQAVMTLPLGCFNTETLEIKQDPKKGVKTKFSKFIPSILFKFDDRLVSYVLSWVEYLKKKGFNDSNPIFPKTLLMHEQNSLCFAGANEVSKEFFTNTSSIRNIFRSRAEAANLPYFKPHSFRDLANQLACKSCKTGEEIKAVSQHFGHEYAATTLSAYGNYDDNKLTEILINIDFSGKLNSNISEKIDEILTILKKIRISDFSN